MNGSNVKLCVECGCPYDILWPSCPECGAPNESYRVAADIRGYATECPNCGAPSNGLRVCQWCKSIIPYVGSSRNSSYSTNRTILECELKRLVSDRNMYSYIICHISVNGHELMQVRDMSAHEGMTLVLLGVQNSIYTNFISCPLMHSFYMSQQGLYTRVFGIDFMNAAQVSDEILQQVYEVTTEQVFCNFEYGDSRGSGSESGNNVAAAAIGGVILGSVLDNF